MRDQFSLDDLRIVAGLEIEKEIEIADHVLEKNLQVAHLLDIDIIGILSGTRVQFTVDRNNYCSINVQGREAWVPGIYVNPSYLGTDLVAVLDQLTRSVARVLPSEGTIAIVEDGDFKIKNQRPQTKDASLADLMFGTSLEYQQANLRREWSETLFPDKRVQAYVRMLKILVPSDDTQLQNYASAMRRVVTRMVDGGKWEEEGEWKVHDLSFKSLDQGYDVMSEAIRKREEATSFSVKDAVIQKVYKE